MLENSPKQFYHGQHESRKTVLDMFWVGVDTVGKRARERFERDDRGLVRARREIVWRVVLRRVATLLRGAPLVALNHC